jgi:hypothetical protein
LSITRRRSRAPRESGRAAPRHRRFARRKDLGLTRTQYESLARLDTPQKIQRFLNRIPANHETEGETLLSAQQVLAQRRAHCLEGAFVAACALWIHGRPPLIVHMDCETTDYPHCIAVFRRGRCWGAISKTNGAVLRFRDPVYRSLRELAMSYFHEYCDRKGRHTLRSYSATFDLRRVPHAAWVTNPKACWDVHERLAGLRHYPMLLRGQAAALSRRDPFESRVAKFVQYPKPKRPRARR